MGPSVCQQQKASGPRKWFAGWPFRNDCSLVSAELVHRINTFLRRPTPPNYVAGSIAEGLLATYGAKGALPADDDVAELLEMAGMESEALVEELENGNEADYFRESAALLAAILAELSAT